MFFTSSGELFLRPDVILSTVGVENEKQFFYKMFREMDYMIYRLKTVFTLKKDEE